MSDRYVKSILVKKYEREETEDEENKATLFTEKKTHATLASFLNPLLS